ncbi:aspartate/glutamate racemase family protein [Kocuria sp.]|uniref:aspartate/glutamate racemase family protein n=1 Tax=Kocuria sp. TaxID=1871328 RepID=UPI0028ADD6B5|nr:aspartate/glutamate racemase family protein [Kocuria sp.]
MALCSAGYDSPAAASIVTFVGRNYSVVTTLGRTVPLIEDRLRLAGLMERCSSVRAPNTSVLDLERDENAAVETIVAEAQRAIEQGRSRGGCPRLRRDGRP